MKEREIRGDGWEVPEMFAVAEVDKRRGEGGRRPRAVPAAGYGTCPSCHANRGTGMVRVGRHFVWRVHDRITMSKVKMVCPASGVAVCAMPGRGGSDPSCPHG
jgi:hypothetical protein